MSGFGWDDGRKLVIAADEQWEELAKACLKSIYCPESVLMTPAEESAVQKVEINAISAI
jgi:hypothetical protein